MKTIKRRMKPVLFIILLVLGITMDLHAGDILIGTAETDITPDLPVALVGQFHMRLAHTIETPLTANVIALESKDGNHSKDMAIMVSCDITVMPAIYTRMVRNEVQKQLPDIDVNKIFLNATHTHTAPVLENDSTVQFPIPETGVVQVDDYRDFFVKQVSAAIVRAWKSRAPGSVTWGMGHATVGQNRRTVYFSRRYDPGPFANGTARMYGDTEVTDFRNMEGMADDDVNTLFFWDKRGKIIAMAIDVPCPSQEVEGRETINADYWHPVRQQLKKRFGSDLCVLGWIAAAGDQSPHIRYRIPAEERMRELRGLDNLEELARRIVLAVEEIYETVEKDRNRDVQLTHKVDTLDLPMFKISEEAYLFSKSERDKYAAMIAADPEAANEYARLKAWHADLVWRYEKQLKDDHPTLATEVHVLRIGDIVICTNPFELYTDFGIRMQARSKALQTFVIQLVGPGQYLPTERAVKGGGYSAIAPSCYVGPEGGRILVDRTVSLIDNMFAGEE